MNILIDTNILITLEDTARLLDPSLAQLCRLSEANGHVLYTHPSQQEDINREPVEELELVDKGALTGQAFHLSGQVDPINDLLNALRAEPSAGYAALAERLEVSEATVKRNIQKLKQQNRIRRIGSKKTGHWEVIE